MQKTIRSIGDVVHVHDVRIILNHCPAPNKVELCIDDPSGIAVSFSQEPEELRKKHGDRRERR